MMEQVLELGRKRPSLGAIIVRTEHGVDFWVLGKSLGNLGYSIGTDYYISIDKEDHISGGYLSPPVARLGRPPRAAGELQHAAGILGGNLPSIVC
jgi:hypothetical protein